MSKQLPKLGILKLCNGSEAIICLQPTWHILVTAPTQAAEYGYGDYLPGYSIPMAGYTPPPGVYFLNTFYLYSGSANVNAEFPIGRIMAVGLTEHFVVNITTTAWYTDVTMRSASLSMQ
jgi:hypothetical protein